MPPLREQAKEQQQWIDERMQHVLPDLMLEYDVDAWILSNQEYVEDVVWRSVASPTQVNARRRTVIVYILDRDAGSVAATTIVHFDPWTQVRAVLEAADPARICVNIHATFAFADGLHAGENEALTEGLGDLSSRMVRVPELAVYFLAVRPPPPSNMEERYADMQGMVWDMIEQAFSAAVITPGTTTLDDVSWWMLEHVKSLGLRSSFKHSVALQRRGTPGVVSAPDTIILRGDHLWCDVGVIAMNLWTDTQHVGYVLREGEESVPQGLQDALASSNRLQDIVMESLVIGRSGNQVLEAVNVTLAEEDLDGQVYTHPIGDFMHGPGPTIGLFDDKNWPIPILGDLVVRGDTWYSIELRTYFPVPEWDGQVIEARQEEDACVPATGSNHFILARQDKYHVVA